MNTLALIWPQIDSNVSDQLLKSSKTACIAHRYVCSQKRSADNYAFQAAEKCRYAIPVHTVSLRALKSVAVILSAIRLWSYNKGCFIKRILFSFFHNSLK